MTNFTTKFLNTQKCFLDFLVLTQKVLRFTVQTTLQKFTLSHYGGLINCYSNEFFQIGHYCSDSNGYWRHQHLADAIKQTPPLHILTHPGWWGSGERAPRSRILDIVLQEAYKTLHDYEKDLQQDGRENIRQSPDGTGQELSPANLQFLLDCLLAYGQFEREKVISLMRSISNKDL